MDGWMALDYQMSLFFAFLLLLGLLFCVFVCLLLLKGMSTTRLSHTELQDPRRPRRGDPSPHLEYLRKGDSDPPTTLRLQRRIVGMPPLFDHTLTVATVIQRFNGCPEYLSALVCRIGVVA